MGTYKVLQDIEAEDKFLGPLTLKQCIFAAVAIVSCYLSFLLLTHGVWVMVFPLVPVIIVTGFLAFPWGRDQPTEVWLLAKIRFMFKPRKRIWDQTGMQELVKITAPPKVVEYMGDNLSQNEVRSRLKALADTIDSRGWAVKGSSGEPAAIGLSSDRLVGESTLPAVGNTVDEPSTDMFDSPLASQISSQISASSSQHRTATTENLQQNLNPSLNPSSAGDNFWFMNQPTTTAPGQAAFGIQSSTPADDDKLSPMFSNHAGQLDPVDAAFLNEVKTRHAQESQSFRNHRHIDPTITTLPTTPNPPVTATSSPATIELARNNDRNVESLAREAGNDEVIVPLH